MWDAWLDLALGSRCAACTTPGRVLCTSCASTLPEQGFQAWPDPVPEGLAPVYVAGRYADPLKALLVAHKEHRVFGLADPLGALLATAVAAGAATGADLLLVGVPSGRRAVRRRGHDPVARMVGAAARRLARPGRRVVSSRLLRQHREVADQAGLDAAERTVNLAGGLRVDAGTQRRLAGGVWTVVVCDDIVTTGATAREAQRALEAVGIGVSAIAAVASTERRRADGPRMR